MSKYFSILIESTLINRNKVFEHFDKDDNYYLLSGNNTETRGYSDVEINFRQNLIFLVNRIKPT